MRELQTSSGLPADGRLTPQTISAMQSALGSQQSETIKAFQTTLSTLGWYEGPIDGAYGPATATAVAGLQLQLGVTADGILGPQTFAAFESQCKPNPSSCEKHVTPTTAVASTTRPSAPPTGRARSSPTDPHVSPHGQRTAHRG